MPLLASTHWRAWHCGALHYKSNTLQFIAVPSIALQYIAMQRITSRCIAAVGALTIAYNGVARNTLKLGPCKGVWGFTKNARDETPCKHCVSAHAVSARFVHTTHSCCYPTQWSPHTCVTPQFVMQVSHICHATPVPPNTCGTPHICHASLFTCISHTSVTPHMCYATHPQLSRAVVDIGRACTCKRVAQAQQRSSTHR